MQPTWITTAVIPATAPHKAYYLHPINGASTYTNDVIAWLLQHRYDPTNTTPTHSRVIAAEINADNGELGPVLADSPQFLAVLPAGKQPHPEDVELARQLTNREPSQDDDEPS